MIFRRLLHRAEPARADALERRAWVAAFPRAISGDVTAVLDTFPRNHAPGGRALTPWSTDSDRHPRGIWVGGEELVIPSRQYLAAVHPTEPQTRPSGVRAAIAGCIGSRHHDGYVRQEWARTLLVSPHPWVVPYVVQLIGEYVVEIVQDIHDTLGPELADESSAVRRNLLTFWEDNPGFVDLTRARASSYWSCYYRGRACRRPGDYPGIQVLDAIGAAAARSTESRLSRSGSGS